MELNKPTLEIIDQMINVVSQLNEETYTRKVQVLSGNTLGKHVRHILEFFLMITNLKSDSKDIPVVSYDKRKHDVEMETNPDFALENLRQLKDYFSKPIKNVELKLAYSYQYESNTKESLVQTSLYREVMYNIEHAIHHMAILQIAMKHVFPEIILPENFGVAYSTVRFHQKIENVYS